MPLLGLFSKRGRTPSKTSTTASKAERSTSNLSLEDDQYVEVPAPRPLYPAQSPASSSKLALPFRRKGEPAKLEQQPQLTYQDPLLEPPPRRSSLFQTYQDDSAYRSTQSLPAAAERRPPRPQVHPQQSVQHGSSPTTKKSMFNWGSNKERAKSVSSPDEESFNLKSFRHVRPDSPASPPSPSPTNIPPIPTPVPTSTLPGPPMSFQVTSRRPRGNSTSELTTTPSQQPVASQQTSQQKMAAGAFRQAARRSATSLSLTDSPVLSPTRASLDDRPPPSLLLTSLPRPGTPTRPPRSEPPRGVSPSAPRVAAPSNPAPRTRTNAFATSSSSSSSSEDEDSDSTSDGGGGLSRKTTIRPAQPRAATLPPLSASVREQIQRSKPPAATVLPSSNTNDSPRAQSSLGVYGPGARPRASLSVGALSPNAKEARASVAVMANARLANTPRPISKSVRTRSPGSDTSESVPSGSDSDEDAPLSSLVPPRRPGTSLSAHSAPATPRKLAQPLVDLEAPSTLTGRPARGLPPMARDEDADARQKSRSSIETGPRSRTSQPLSPQRASQAPSPQSTRLSSRPLVSLDTPIAPGSGRSSILSPGGGTRQSSMPGDGKNLVPQGGQRANPSPPSPPVAPPSRPFARRESPASSTGDSSSGKAPLTPRDGSDLGGTARSAYSGPSSASASRGRSGAPGHGRKSSVTFEDEEAGPKGKSRERDNVSPQEQRRRERRRSEARAAIELGNVVNGPPPVDEDDLALGQHPGLQPGWPQPGMQMPMQMQIPMPPVPPMFNMNMGMPSPSAFGYSPPPPGTDPAFLAAHQQAMAIAKQTFQYAVAQQALAAANDEWERGSTATGFGGGGQQWGGYGMGMGMGGMRTNTMYSPPAPRSMYAGSVGGGGGGGWGGTGSVYGASFGPAAAGPRTSTFSQVDLSPGAQRPPRPRTKTAPSAPSLPTGSSSAGGRMPGPPSSFRSPGH